MINKYENNIIQGNQGILNGTDIVYNIIKPTYGGKGSNIIIGSTFNPKHLIANDFETIVQAMKFTDKAESKGLDFIKELSGLMNTMSGDARKTAFLIYAEILRQGTDAITNGKDKMELKRELDELIPIIENEIDRQTVDVGINGIENVATTSSENKDTGKLLHEIYQKIGKEGIIIPESSGTFETSYKFIEGVRFDMTGFLSPYMVHDEQAIKDKVKETRAVYENPLILVTKKKITTDDDINPLLNELEMQGKKDLIIFTNDMDSGVASMLIALHRSHRFNICIIKAPTLWQNSVFEDFAKCTGATIIEDSTGKDFKSMRVSELGTCGKIMINEEETIITGIADISEHIEKLTTKIDEESKLRLSWLTNKTVILKLGANSETDLSYKRLKTYDAIRSSQSALKYGIVKGGGICLATVSESLPDTIAGKIMIEALKAPRKQIVENSKTDVVPETVVDVGFNLKKAVRNAVGIASTVLTAPAYIYIPDLTPQEMAYQVATQQNNPFQ